MVWYVAAGPGSGYSERGTDGKGGKALKKRIVAVLVALALAALTIAPAFAQGGIIWGD